VSGSAGVMALVLAETVAGALAFLWCTPLWAEVKRGFFTLCGSIVLVLALAGWWSARTGRMPGDDAGAWAERMTLALAVVVLVWTALLFVRAAAPARLLGMVSVPLSLAVLIPLAETGRQAVGVALFELLAGAVFLGAVVTGLLLGHWYLTDRRLSRTPINRSTRALLGAVVIEALAVVAAGFGGVGSSEAFNPLLTAGALAPWIALGMVGTTALIGVLVLATLRGTRASAVQSATGFFYLAVVTAFTAEVAVKVRFLPG
jgi:hypothetical protein